MNRPPYLMRLQIKNQDNNINLWLPLFIILPVVAIIFIIAVPLILVAAAILWPYGWGKPLVMAIPAVLGCLCALRGLEVDITQNKEKVFISIR